MIGRWTMGGNPPPSSKYIQECEQRILALIKERAEIDRKLRLERGNLARAKMRFNRLAKEVPVPSPEKEPNSPRPASRRRRPSSGGEGGCS